MALPYVHTKDESHIPIIYPRNMLSVLRKTGKFFIVWSFMALLWIVLWIAFSSLGGWPSNDDPFYAKPLFFWANEGQWRSVKQYGDLTASSLSHQSIAWLLTIGSAFSYRYLFLVCIAQQSFGVTVVYCTSRAMGVSISNAILMAVSLAVFPLYYGHAFTFMTDGPATAWGVVACCCSVLGIVRNSCRWMLIASLSIGLGYWMRQTNVLLLLAPLSAWASLVWRNQSLNRWYYARIVALLLPASVAIVGLESGLLIDSNLSRFKDVAPRLDCNYVKNTVIASYGAAMLLGWFMMPWMLHATGIAFSQLRKQHLSSKCIGIVTALSVFAAGFIPFAMTGGNACLTNSTGVFISNAHFGPIFLSDMDEPQRWSDLGNVRWPLLYWKIVSLVAIINSAIFAWWIAWTLCEFFRPTNCESHSEAHNRHVAIAMGLLISCLLASAFLVFFVEPHMDRYWLFVLAAFLVWWINILLVSDCQVDCIRGPILWRLVSSSWAIACVLIHFGMSSMFTHDMLAWNNARWFYIHTQLQRGMKPDEIDGGRDVNAWFRLDEDRNTNSRKGDTSRWWSGRSLRSLAVGERPGWHEVDRIPWFSWATGQEHYLLVLDRDDRTNP